MFRDTEKELARLEAELLAAEEPVEENCDDLSEVYDEADTDDCDKTETIRSYRVYNTDTCDEDWDSYTDEVLTPSKKGVSAILVILFCLLTLGIVATVALFLYQEGLL